VSDPTPQAQPGWYPIAVGSPQLRWWDGTKWTEHTHDPATAYGLQQQTLKAPEGTRPYTVWIWILALLPLVSLIEIPLLNYGAIFRASLAHPQDPTSMYTPAYLQTQLVLDLVGLVILAINVVLAVVDQRALKRAGVPKTFPWGWGFLSGVYVIGRSVIVRRRVGRGIAPMWVWISVLVVSGIYAITVVSSAIASVLPQIPVGG
jgi:hypothetical protein